MRYGVIPAWTFVMLIVMGVGFICGAVPFWLFVPVSGHFVALIWLLMGLGFIFFSVRALVGRRDDARIRQQGIRATATLLSANYSGVMVNNMPQWTLHLRIDGNGPAYETKMTVRTFDPPSNGTTMTVRVDPQRREHVVFADDADDAPAAPATPSPASTGGAQPDAAATVRLLSDLDRMHSDGTLSDEQFAALKAKLIDVT